MQLYLSWQVAWQQIQRKKQVDPMGPSGECLMEYSIYDAKNAGFDQLVLIINDYFNQETKDHFQAIADKAGIKLDLWSRLLILFTRKA
jgi:hypothetical protein